MGWGGEANQGVPQTGVPRARAFGRASSSFPQGAGFRAQWSGSQPGAWSLASPSKTARLYWVVEASGRQVVSNLFP